jgi:hypothetical protein
MAAAKDPTMARNFILRYKDRRFGLSHCNVGKCWWGIMILQEKLQVLLMRVEC